MGFDRIIRVALQAPFFGPSLPSPYINRESPPYILFSITAFWRRISLNLIWTGPDCVVKEAVFSRGCDQYVSAYNVIHPRRVCIDEEKKSIC
jgi:hypothetical protein